MIWLRGYCQIRCREKGEGLKPSQHKKPCLKTTLKKPERWSSIKITLPSFVWSLYSDGRTKSTLKIRKTICIVDSLSQRSWPFNLMELELKKDDRFCQISRPRTPTILCLVRTRSWDHNTKFLLPFNSLTVSPKELKSLYWRSSNYQFFFSQIIF